MSGTQRRKADEQRRTGAGAGLGLLALASASSMLPRLRAVEEASPVPIAARAMGSGRWGLQVGSAMKRASGP